MSGRTRIHFMGALALAAVVGAGLVRPSIGLAQTVTPEQALLNHTAPSVDVTASFSTIPGGSLHVGSSDVAGDRALLGRVEAPSVWEGKDSLATAAIDGERALLGRWPLALPRQPEDWAGRVANQDTVES